MTSPQEPAPRADGAAAGEAAEAARLLARLSPREAQALDRLAAGDDTQAIAAALRVSPSTARSHLHRAMRKLGVADREQAIALVRTATPAPGQAASEPAPEPARTFDASLDGYEEFHAHAHRALLQQTFLLTGNRRRAARAVRRAFGVAWNRWGRVADSPDPESWLRVRAFDAALAPWRRGGPRRAHTLRLPRPRIRVAPLVPGPDEVQPDGLTDRDRALLKALLRLSRPRRRAVVLHDALGLPAALVADEVEASPSGVEQRVRAAHAALARSVPGLVGGDPDAAGFGERLGGLLYRAAVHGCPEPAAAAGPSPTRRRSTWPLRVAGRLRAAALPGAAGLLVLATLGTLGATLAGRGPSTLFATPTPGPPPSCITAGNGSAGPAAPGRDVGLRSPWCGASPGQPAVLIAQSAAPAAPSDAPTAAPTATPTATASDATTDAASPAADEDAVTPPAVTTPVTTPAPTAAPSPPRLAVCPGGLLSPPCPPLAHTAPPAAWPPAARPR